MAVSFNSHLTNFYKAFSYSFGLAKIIRPAEVCNTLVTITSIL